MHVFPLSVSWSGSTAAPDYDRAGTASAVGKPDLELSSGAGVGADPGAWNPEDLLGAALGQCHLLTFLALAHKARLDVRSCEVDAVVVLETVERLTSVTRVRLDARIEVAPGTDEATVTVLFEKAHKYCYVANSVRSTVEINSRVVDVAA